MLSLLLLWLAAPRLSPETEHILGLSRAAPPEFAADVILTVIETGRVPDVKKRRELVEDAFVLAGYASQPHRRAALPGAPPGSRFAILNEAYARGLDALSLETRAVRDALHFDADLARELFARLPRLTAPPLTCDDTLVYDFSAFYETLTALANAAPEQDRGRFLAPFFEAINSPAEIGPAVKTLSEAKLTEGQFRAVVEAFAGAVGRMSADDRSFSATMALAPRDLETLAILCKRKGAPSESVISALARYLVRHISAVRCADTLPQVTPSESAAVWVYNNRTRLLAPTEPPPIREDELRPARIEMPERVQPKGEDFHIECRRLAELSASAPAGPDRDAALRRYLDFVAGAKLQEENRIEWFYEVTALLSRPDARQLMESSANVTLALYSRLNSRS
jgi:hypothetical protein